MDSSFARNQTQRDNRSMRGVMDITGVKASEAKAVLSNHDAMAKGNVHVEHVDGRTLVVTSR